MVELCVSSHGVATPAFTESFVVVAVKVKEDPEVGRVQKTLKVLCLSREELLLLKEESDEKVRRLEGRCGELQSVIQQASEDFQKV